MSLFFVSCVSGCAQTDAEECIETSVSVSQSERWLLGNTLSLPSFRSDNSDCDQLEWAKIEAPKASNNALVLTEFGQVFTPDQVGDYRFQLIEGDSSLDFFFELTAKDISATGVMTPPPG